MFKKALISIKLPKVLAVIAIIVLGLQSGFAQDTNILIGQIGDYTSNYPIDRYKKYTVWEGIYLSNEINRAGYLTRIGFYLLSNGDKNDFTNIKIYAKQTHDTSIYIGNFSKDGYTLVFEGNLNNIINNGDWLNFNLKFPFYYEGGAQNLQIAVEHGPQSQTEYIQWGVSSTNTLLSRSNSLDNEMPTLLYATDMRPSLQLGLGCLFINPGVNKSICNGNSSQIGGDTIALFPKEEECAYTYQWSPSDGLNNDTVTNPVASPTSTTEYTVTVNSQNCTAQTSTPVIVYVGNENQEIIMGQQELISMCNSGAFFDSGGDKEEYSYNEDKTLTVYPCDSLHKIAVDFRDFDIEYSANCEADWLKIYNGNNTNCELIGAYCGNPIIPEIISSHRSGALTFVFHSNQIGSGSGWNAGIHCVERQCEEIAGIATITTDINDFNSGHAVLGLSNYWGRFKGWQFSYDGKDYRDYDTKYGRDSITLHVFNEVSTYYRAIVTNNNEEDTCYSNPVKHVLGRNFYVNDASLSSDIYCTAIGSDKNDGLSKESPVDRLSTIIARYDLRAGDVVLVDVGVYNDEILFGPNDFGDSLKKIRIIGAGALDRTNFIGNKNLLTFESTSDIEIRNIRLQNENTDTKTIRILNSSGISVNRCVIESEGENVVILGKDRERGDFSDHNRFYYNILNTRRNGYTNIIIESAVNDLGIDTNLIQGQDRDFDTIENGSTAIAILGRDIPTPPENIRIDSNYFFGYRQAIYGEATRFFSLEGEKVELPPLRNIKIKDNWIDNISSSNDLSTSIRINWVDSLEISYNRIYKSNTSIGLSGIYNLRVFNNFISKSDTGISITEQSNNIGIYNNSFYNSKNNVSFRGIVDDHFLRISVQNNIFHNTSSSSDDCCILMDECSNKGNGNLLDLCNNNLYFTPNDAKLAKFGGNIFSNLDELKGFCHVNDGKSNGDENSVVGDPEYFDAEEGELSVYESSAANGKAASIWWLPDDNKHIYRRFPSFIGGGSQPLISCPTGPYAELKRKLDGGYHLTNSGYLLIKYTEEYNPLIPKLKFKIYDMNRTVVLSSDMTSGVINNHVIKYGDNYCCIKLWGLLNGCHTKAIPVGYYILEVSNDKNEKWYLRFKQEYVFNNNYLFPFDCLKEVFETFQTHLSLSVE